jgi:hypothetical protein
MQWLAGLLGAYSEGNVATEYSDLEISDVFYAGMFNRVSLKIDDQTIVLMCEVHR